jgi:exo-1,4-beta-D-glucosaminidase
MLMTAAVLACRPAEPPVDGTTVVLRDGWAIRSAAKVAASGAEISRPGFDRSGWTPTAVPSTVLAALVREGVVPDPYYAKNLEAIPAERFAAPWWYRVEFAAPEPLPAEARLVFEGINYSADVWLNGHKIAGREDLRGAFRVFELAVTPHLVAGTNVLAVQVFPPAPGDPTVGFVDWNPKPPDRSMGLWREVKLRATRGVSLEDVVVRSELDPKSLAEARLSIGARLTNHTDHPVTATLRGRIGPHAAISIEREVSLRPREERQLVLTPKDLPQLALRSPRLWWPHDLGEPNLYTLELDAGLDGQVSDRQSVTFGIRHVEDYLTPEGHRGYAVNGRKVLVRGGGWVDDLLLTEDPQRLEDQMRYVRHMHLNTIRLEGFWGNTRKLYELADRHGIMIWAGWSCQWEWEDYLGQPVDETYGGIDTPAEMDLIARSWRDQVIRLRNHPSVVVWNLASDMLPRPELEKRYRTMLAKIDPTRPPLAACSVRTSEVSGPTGVKMNGPYEWVPPDYWYLDRERGGAYGFNTETGPGAQPPTAESIRRMLPREHWWPIDEMWNYHCGRGKFDSLDRYVAALDARYGKSSGLDDFAYKAQVANYEAMRAMFEAFSLRRPTATGIVQWMLNSAWPDMFWQLYDWYLVPTGAFYGARNANRPVNVAYDYGTRKVVVVNDTAAPLRGVTARVRVFDVGSRVLFDEAKTLDVAAGNRREVLALPAMAPAGAVYLVDARVERPGGELMASNWYWLSAQGDELDWEKSEWFVTPTKRYADLTALARLPQATLEVQHRFVAAEDGKAVEVTLSNPGPRLALAVELKVAGSKSGRLAAPIYWDDNYVSLAPGETRRIRGTFPAHALSPGETPVLRFQGMNTK